MYELWTFFKSHVTQLSDRQSHICSGQKISTDKLKHNFELAATATYRDNDWVHTPYILLISVQEGGVWHEGSGRRRRLHQQYVVAASHHQRVQHVMRYRHCLLMTLPYLYHVIMTSTVTQCLGGIILVNTWYLTGLQTPAGQSLSRCFCLVHRIAFYCYS